LAVQSRHVRFIGCDENEQSLGVNDVDADAVTNNDETLSSHVADFWRRRAYSRWLPATTYDNHWTTTLCSIDWFSKWVSGPDGTVQQPGHSRDESFQAVDFTRHDMVAFAIVGSCRGYM